MSRKTLTAASLLTLLITAVSLVIYGQTRTVEPTFHGKLADVLPPAPPGWTRIEHPIADTPEMRQKVDELLSFDDGVFYVYTSGSMRLSVYVAYWKPGKMSSRLVAGHTPDVCWVASGWKCTAKQSRDEIFSGDTQLPVVESRTFQTQGLTEYVWFWHIVDGVAQSYSTGGKPPWHAMFTDFWQRGLNQRSEQMFIRLSSDTPLDDPALQPVLNAVLAKLPLSQD